MDDPVGMERPDAAIGPEPAVVEEASVEYLGRWNRLVSTTNWEKGRIISQWRESLIEAGAPVQSYSDEAWSRRVGSVSGQHVGRLRRVFERFADEYEQYTGLCWSHFQAALDWDDPEMWLEGAAKSGWSVAQMRAQRWEAIGAPPDLKPREEDIITAELDEDAPAEEPAQAATAGSVGEIRDVADEAADPLESEATGDAPAVDDAEPPAQADDAVEPIRPFEDLPSLPDDLADALESMKLAILHHKLDGWQEITRDNVLQMLDGLKQLAASPAEG